MKNEQKELWEQAAMELFIAHNPKTSPHSPIGKVLLESFRKDMEILKLFFELSKRS